MSTELHYDDTDEVEVLTGTPTETDVPAIGSEPADAPDFLLSEV